MELEPVEEIGDGFRKGIWSVSITFVRFKVKFPESRCSSRFASGEDDKGLETPNAQMAFCSVALSFGIVKASLGTTDEACRKHQEKSYTLHSVHVHLSKDCRGTLFVED